MRDKDAILLESLYTKNVLIFEAAESKIRKFKITDPFLINFIYRYENLIPWNDGLNNEKSIQEYIRFELVNEIHERIDQESINTNPKTYYSKQVDWEREIQNLKNEIENGNRQAQQVLDYVEANPEEAKERILKEINRAKEKLFSQWWKYINNYNDVYAENPAFQFIILSSIFSGTNSKRNTGIIPLNQNLVSTIYEQIEKNPKNQFKVLDSYKQLSQEFAEKTLEVFESGDGKWIKIPSEDNDPEQFEDNLKQLMSLAANTNWCIAGETFARKYLSGGDFYIYFIKNSDGKETGVAAIRMDGDDVAEIRGTESNQNMNDIYVDNVLDLVKHENLSGGEDFVKNLVRQKKIIQIKAEIKNLPNTIKETGLTEELKQKIREMIGKSENEVKFYTRKNNDIVIFAISKWSNWENMLDNIKAPKNLNSYCEYINGNSFWGENFDSMSKDKSILKDLYEDVRKQHPNIIKEIEDNTILEYGNDDEAPDDIFDYLWDIDSQIIDKLQIAYEDGHSAGSESQIIEAFKEGIKDLTFTYSDYDFFYQATVEFENDFQWHDSPIWLRINLEDIGAYMGIQENGSYDNEVEGDMDVPYYGFDGYDEDAAISRFVESYKD